MRFSSIISVKFGLENKKGKVEEAYCNNNPLGL